MTLIDLEPLRGGDVTEERALEAYGALVGFINSLDSPSGFTEEIADNTMRAAALLHQAGDEYSTMLVDLLTRAPTKQFTVLPPFLNAARALREDPEVAPFLDHLKSALLSDDKSKGIADFYGDEFHALRVKVEEALDGLELQEHDPKI